MSLDPLLLNLLACPIDKQALLYLAEDDVLYNPRLRRLYRVRDGIPVMLADQGETVSDDRHRDLLGRAAAGGARPPFRCRCVTCWPATSPMRTLRRDRAHGRRSAAGHRIRRAAA